MDSPCATAPPADLPPMRIHATLVSCLLGGLLPVMADPPSKSGAPHRKAAASPAYRSESPLPKGWPEPGPYDQVVRKKYPAYRAAFTPTSNSNGGFWKLFKHIERKGIPMTAPVEMKLDPAEKNSVEMEEMAFLYQTPDVGKTGADGEHVEVRDVPAREALSYAWQGARTKAATTRAREALDAELAKQKLTAAGYRLLGYNSPFVPPAKQTHELQALIR
jgi:SOUL heme-binding protein